MTPQDTARHAALSALFEQVKGVPGCVVELGVASGASLRIWLKLSRGTRAVWGFDTFAGFPTFATEDGPMVPAIGKCVGGETELRPRPLRADEVNAPSARLVVGDIPQTLPAAVAADLLGPIALVFCDADTYAPTEAALRLLWPLLSPGGLFVFDEYGQEPWPGETKAVDDFVALKRLPLMKLTMESGPTAYVVKP